MFLKLAAAAEQLLGSLPPDDADGDQPPHMRGWEWRALQNARQQGLDQWAPRLLPSNDAPLTTLLASPAKQSLLYGLLGAGGGALGAQQLGGDLKTQLASGGILGLLGGTYGYLHRRNRNDELENAMRWIPPGATVGDFRELQQQQHQKGAATAPALPRLPRAEAGTANYLDPTTGATKAWMPQRLRALQSNPAAAPGADLHARSPLHEQFVQEQAATAAQRQQAVGRMQAAHQYDAANPSAWYQQQARNSNLARVGLQPDRTLAAPTAPGGGPPSVMGTGITQRSRTGALPSALNPAPAAVPAAMAMAATAPPQPAPPAPSPAAQVQQSANTFGRLQAQNIPSSPAQSAPNPFWSTLMNRQVDANTGQPMMYGTPATDVFSSGPQRAYQQAMAALPANTFFGLPTNVPTSPSSQ